MSSPRRVRVGVLGAGAWAAPPTSPAGARPTLRDRRHRRSARGWREARGEFGIPLDFDWQALIAHDGIDVIDVCTPRSTHFELAWAALEAGRHVLCEKPVAYDFRDTRRAAALARARASRPSSGFTFRYSPGVRYAPAGRRRLRRHAVHLQRLRAELAVARPDEPAAPGRSARRSRRSCTSPRSKATARRSSTSATGGRQPTDAAWSARCATSSPSAWCAPPA